MTKSCRFLIGKRRKINKRYYKQRKKKAQLPLILPLFIFLCKNCFLSLGFLLLYLSLLLLYQVLPVFLYLLSLYLFRLICLLYLLCPVPLRLLYFHQLGLFCLSHLLCLFYLFCLLCLLHLPHLFSLLCLLFLRLLNFPLLYSLLFCQLCPSHPCIHQV